MSRQITKHTIDPIEIFERLSWSESDDYEYKSAKGGLPESLWATYSGMANTNGGLILLGVQNDGSVTGIENPDKIKIDFWNTINNKGKVSVNILSNQDLHEIPHSQGIIFAIKVRKANRKECPIFVGQNPLTGTYRRTWEGDYHCTESEVRRMLSDQLEDGDSRILEKFTIEDLDSNSLKQYRNRFSNRDPDHPWNKCDDLIFLQKIGAYRKCRDKGVEGVTVAGLLMFGLELSILEVIPKFHLDFREKLSLNKDIRWTDRLSPDGSWEANLYQFYSKVIQKLASDLKMPFQLDNDLIRKGETEVHVAIREAFVNALIHADYFGQGGVVIEKYQDKFKFSNPGTMLVSFSQLLEGGISDCRNSSLQKMFILIGAAEKAGSGIDKIISGWKSQHWRYPHFRETHKPTRVEWILPMVSLIPHESLMRLKTLFGEIKTSTLNTYEIQSLVTADLEGNIDNARMRQITRLHPYDLTKLLQNLVKKEYLRQLGQGRGTQYCLNNIQANLLHKHDNPLHKDDNPLHNDDNPLHKDDNPLHNDDNHLNKNILSHFSDEIIEELIRISEPARLKQRLAPEGMEAVIIQLCEKQWLTKNHFEVLLNRSGDGIRNRFLTPLVKESRLKLKYPEIPSHIEQAYTKA